MRRYLFAIAPLSAASIWGGMYVVSKWGFSLIPPLTLSFLRVALGGIVLYAILHSKGITIDPTDRPRFIILGAWVAITVAFQFIGTDLTTASQGSLLTVLTPVFTVLLGITILNETTTPTKLLGVGIALAGTLIVIAGRYDLTTITAGNSLGVTFLILSSFCWAGYTVWGVPVIDRYSALTAATYSTLAAIPMLAIPAAIELWYTTPPLAEMTSIGAIFAIAYLGIASTAAAWYLWYKGLEYVPAGTVAVFFFIQPVVGTLLGAAFLAETIGPAFILGGLVMGVGIIIVSRERSNDQQNPPPETDRR